MNIDYVHLTNLNSFDDLEIKYKFLKKYPKLLKLYFKIAKPFKKEIVTIGNINGFKIEMSFTKDQIYEDEKFVQSVINKTMKNISKHHIKTILYNDYNLSLENIYKVNGKYLMAFFIKDAITQLISLSKKDMKNIEVLIISEDNFLTTMIIENIFMSVNFISIINETNYDFTYLNDTLFRESGLILNLVEKNNYSLENADIIINTSNKSNINHYVLKRGCIYFDFAVCKKNTLELARKRSDILIIDNFLIKYNKNNYQLDYFELGFYSYSKEYRNLVSNNYKSFYIHKVKEDLKKLNTKFLQISSLNKVLTNIEIKTLFTHNYL